MLYLVGIVSYGVLTSQKWFMKEEIHYVESRVPELHVLYLPRCSQSELPT